MIPLVAEAAGFALAGFAAGLLIAYLIVLRIRNRQEYR